MRYRDLTDIQKQEICNGCGGKGGWIKPPHSSFFKEECNQHDFNYFLGFTEEHRKKADKQLKQAMLEKCNSLPFFKKFRYKPWCYIYYRAVRIKGKDFFYYGIAEQALPETLP